MGLTRALGVTGLAAAVASALVTLFGAVTGFERTDGGEVAVIRDGGPLDDRGIRQIVDPASGLTWAGLWSSAHRYPAQQRFYTITADAKRATTLGVDVVTVPSSDGVDLGIEGTLYFTLNLDHETLKRFDDKFGTRTFRGQDGEQRHAWDGDEGWAAFFGQAVRPVVDNALRAQIGAMRCAELVPTCALVDKARQGVRLEPHDANGGIARVQNAVNTTLEHDLAQTLGDRFLTGMRFNLVRVALPQDVQQAVTRALAASARVAEALAEVDSAEARAKADRARQSGYERCPACADIDKLKSLPQGITVYAPGNSEIIVPSK